MSGFGGTENIVNKVINHYSRDEDKSLNLVSYYSVKGKKWCNANIEFIDIHHDKVKNNYLLALTIFSFFIRTHVDKVIITNQLALPIIKFARIFNSHKFEIISWVHFDLVQGPMSSERKIKSIVNNADKFISLSDSNSKLLLSKGFNKKNIYTVYNPVEFPEQLIPNSNDGIFRFISVGRLQFSDKTQKNNKELFDALIFLKNLNWTLDIYGNGDDFEVEKNYISENGLSNKVFFHGWTERPFEKIKLADCLVMTSTFEGFPLTLVESLSYGIPVICSDINGPNEIINKDNGILYERGNINQLSSVLKSMICKDIIFNQQHVKESCNKFSSNNYFKKFDRIF